MNTCTRYSPLASKRGGVRPNRDSPAESCRTHAWQIGGVYGLSFLWTIAGANLRHSHVWLPYPSWLERVLISPAQHQLHHAVDPQLHHSNYGSALAIWDLLSGTLRLSGRRPRLAFGLPAAQQNHARTVRSVLWHPLVRASRRLAAAFGVAAT